MTDIETNTEQKRNQVRSRTPIADELAAHFRRGGSPADAITLVAALEGSTKRGARLPLVWWPTDAEIAWAASYGLSSAHIKTEALKFRNYWHAKAGKGATKRDWSATWRNWILNLVGKNSYGRASGGYGNQTNGGIRQPLPTGSDAILTGMGRLAAKIDEGGPAKVKGTVWDSFDTPPWIDG